jgi:diguanylate cyclase (GGDEF)-like protein
VIKNRQDKEYAVRITRRPVFSKEGSQAGNVYAINDLTEIIRINKKIALIATHDTLTGLPNRSLIQDLIKQAISSAEREGSTFAVLFIDLDGFKKINDGMGHVCGDVLLQVVAKRLENCIRKSDTTARWGGDEFIVLLDKLSNPSDAADISIKIKSSLAKEFNIRNQDVFVTPSIGIILFPADGQQVDTLIARADTAMYNVKIRSKNDFCFYSQDFETQAKEKLILDAQLRHALQSNEFKIHYQPQFDLNSSQLMGMEALIRWQHPQKGLIAPDEFIPLAEETGLIVPIGEWLIKTICQQLKIWKQQGLSPPQLAINISARQFLQKNLVTLITQEMDRHGIAPNSIQIEITESMMIQDIEQVNSIMNEFKSAGISIAIDDFGTGYSSLEYLKRLPIDKLKIDKSFIGNILNNSDDASIVQAVIAMGHSMNMQIIAEGVETKEQAEFLSNRNCDYAQGFYFSKPVSALDMEKELNNLSLLGC